MARPEGVEPPTYRSEVCRSIQLSYGRRQKWRREWDSNPRGEVCPRLLDFQSSAFDQLSHLSALFSVIYYIIFSDTSKQTKSNHLSLQRTQAYKKNSYLSRVFSFFHTLTHPVSLTNKTAIIAMHTAANIIKKPLR